MIDKTDEFIKSLFFLVFFVIAIGVSLKYMNTQSDKQDEIKQTHAEQVRVFKHDLNKVAKQKYVTIAQFKEIKRRADKLSTKHDSKSVDTVVDKFDRLI